MERSDGALSCFKNSGFCPASCLTGRPCSMLIRIGPLFEDSNLLGRGAMVDSGRSFFDESLLSEPDEYAESGGGVDFSASCVGSSGTGKCFIRLERRLANPVLRESQSCFPTDRCCQLTFSLTMHPYPSTAFPCLATGETILSYSWTYSVSC